MTDSPEFHNLTLIVGGLKTSVDSMSRQSERQEENATAGRRALHEKFEALQQSVGAQLTSLNLRVDRVVDTMKDVEPAVKAFKEEQLREEGAKRLGKGLIAGLTAAAGVIGWAGHELFTYLKH